MIKEFWGIWKSKKVFVDEKELTPEASLNLRRYREEEPFFDWGGGTGGTAQLALAILLYLIPEKDALGMFQTFKKYVVGRKTKEADFHLPVKDVEAWIKENGTHRCKECGCMIPLATNIKFKSMCEICHDRKHPELVPKDERPENIDEMK